MLDPLLYLTFFLVYSIFILIFGKHGFNKTEDLKEYFLAGRNLSLFPSVASFYSTWFSSASILALPGLVYENGISTFWTTAIAWMLGGVLLFLIISKLYSYDVLTIPEFLAIRYQAPILQIGVGVILVVSYVLYIMLQITGFGIVVSSLLEIPYSLSIFLVYLFILYTTFGGLYSVARTDIFHFILIFLSTIVGASLMIEKAHRIPFIEQLQLLEENGQLPADFFYFFPNTWSFVWVLLSAFFALGLGVAANPQYGIRLISAKSARVAQKMLVISFIFIFITYCAIFILGIGLRALAPDLTFQRHDEIYPYIIHHEMASPLKGFIFISIIAASISTANSQLLILASSFVHDIYGQIKKQPLSNAKSLNMVRATIFLFGSISLLCSLFQPQAIVLMSGHIWGLISSMLFFPVFGGLLLKNVTKKSAVYSSLSGVLTYIIGFLFIPPQVQSIIHPVLPAIVISGLCYWLGRKGHR